MAPPTYVEVALNSMAVVSCGMTIAFPAVALPSIKDHGVSPTPTQVSLVGCLFYSSILISSFAIEPMLEKWGRRKSFLTSIAASIVGWLLLCASKSDVAIVGCFVFLGAGLGSTNPCVSVYLAEIVNRRWLLSINVMRSALFFSGLTIMYAIGYIFEGDLQLIGKISSSLPALVFFLGLFCMRETKAWLQRPPPVDRSMTWFGPYAQLLTALKGRDDVQRPLCLLNIITILRQLSGTAVLITYAIEFAAKVVPNIDPFGVAVLMGTSNIVGCLFVPIIANLCSRRQTVIYAGVVASWSLLALARLPFITGMSVNEIPSFFQMTLLSTFIASSTVFLFVSQSLIEWYPVDVRNACSIVSNFNSWFASGVTVVTFPVLSICLELQSLLLFYAGASVFSVIFTIIGVPDIDINPRKSADEHKPADKMTEDASLPDEALPLQTLAPQDRDFEEIAAMSAGDATTNIKSTTVTASQVNHVAT